MKLLQKLIERLYFSQDRNLALYDQMTGLYNNNWMRYIGCKKYLNEACVVTMIDINNFKLMNDTNGHIYADKTITWLSKQLCKVSECEPSAAIIRYGGDEFVIISSTDLKGKIIEEFNKTDRISLSIGSYNKKAGEELLTAVEIADREMYKMKYKFHFDGGN